MVHHLLAHRQVAVPPLKNGTAAAEPSSSSAAPADKPKAQSSSSLPPPSSASLTPVPKTTQGHSLPIPPETTSLSLPKDVLLSNGTASAAPLSSDSALLSSAVKPSPSFIEEEDISIDISEVFALPTSTPPTPVPTHRVSSTHSMPPITHASLPPAASSSGASADSSSGLLDTGALIGIIVAGSVVVLSLLGLCIACGVRVRRGKRTHAALDDPPALLRPAVPPHPVRPMTQVTQVTLPEARDSVYTGYAAHGGYPARELGREFAPPARSHPAFVGTAGRSSRATSAWTDHSEADAFAHDGSTIARTLSTVSRPNSEYDLENDPGATFRACPGTPGTFGLPASSSFGPYSHSVANSLDLGPAVGAAAGYTAVSHATNSSYATNSGYSGYQSPGPSYGNTYHSSSLAGPSYVPIPQPQPRQVPVPAQPQPQPPQQRMPAPHLLVDTKRSLAENPSSPFYEGLSAAGSSSSRYAERGYSQILSPSSSGMRTSLSGMGTMGTVTTMSSMSSAPLSPPPASPERTTGASGLQRGPTIIRHADAGAFADAVPENSAEVHLPPAYGDIYGPPAA